MVSNHGQSERFQADGREAATSHLAQAGTRAQRTRLKKTSRLLQKHQLLHQVRPAGTQISLEF